MILHLYFARRFALLFLQLLVVFAVMVFLIDVMEQLRIFGSHDLSRDASVEARAACYETAINALREAAARDQVA